VLRERIDETRHRGGRLLVPTIVLAEALDIAEKGRSEFDFAEMYRLIQAEPEFEIVGFGDEILEEAMHIREIQEIHDRIIVATARFYGTGVLTRDRIIRDSGEVEVLY
jgi:predicted nucleic acid-binding protein